QHRGDRDETHQDQLANAQPGQKIKLFLLGHPRPPCWTTILEVAARLARGVRIGSLRPCRKHLSRNPGTRTRKSLRQRRPCRRAEKITFLPPATRASRPRCASSPRWSVPRW